jgi:hypothetical protein
VTVHRRSVDRLHQAVALEEDVGGALLPGMGWNAADLHVREQSHLNLLSVVAA